MLFAWMMELFGVDNVKLWCDVPFLFAVSFPEWYSINCLRASYFATNFWFKERKETKDKDRLGEKRKIKLFWSSEKKRRGFLLSYLGVWRERKRGFLSYRFTSIAFVYTLLEKIPFFLLKKNPTQKKTFISFFPFHFFPTKLVVSSFLTCVERKLIARA